VSATFRSATQADAGPVRELVYQVLREFGFTPDPAGTDADLEDLERSYLARGGVFELLLDEQGKLVGCVGLYPIDEATAELRKMYLRPDARGHGHGQRLLDHALGHARRLGFGIVVLQTATILERALTLYLRAGFAPYEPEERVSRSDLALRLVLDPDPAPPER